MEIAIPAVTPAPVASAAIVTAAVVVMVGAIITGAVERITLAGSIREVSWLDMRPGPIIPSKAGPGIVWNKRANIPSGSTVLSIDSPTQIHISQNATAAGTNPVVFGNTITFTFAGVQKLYERVTRANNSQGTASVMIDGNTVSLSATDGGTFIDGGNIITYTARGVLGFATQIGLYEVATRSAYNQ